MKTFAKHCFMTAVRSIGGVARARARKAAQMPFIDAVSLHGTPPALTDKFKAMVESLLQSRMPATLADVQRALRGDWDESKPGLLVCFDDGRLDNYTVAAPVLESLGLRGVFFVPVDFVECPTDQQPAFVQRHSISYGQADSEPVYAMSWEQLRDLEARGHSIGAHTSSHRRLPAGVGAADLEYELVRSKAMLAAKLGHPPEAFCWVGGEPGNFSREAAQIIGREYALAFTSFYGVINQSSKPHYLARHNIEAHWPLEQVEFYLSGWMQERYARRAAGVWQRIAS